ncbi:MAG: hypothetical protein BHW39_09965 [Firmicutes bacterium CAG:552_39_19]|nr:MAG: hypothetical protein BHW39_09965 [Firmicutes bacterium CAG:552_39_19]
MKCSDCVNAAAVQTSKKGRRVHFVCLLFTSKHIKGIDSFGYILRLMILCTKRYKQSKNFKCVCITRRPIKIFFIRAK